MAFNQGFRLMRGNDRPPPIPFFEWTRAPYDSTPHKKVFKALFLTSKSSENQDDSAPAPAASETNLKTTFQTVHLESTDSTRDPKVTIHCVRHGEAEHNVLQGNEAGFLRNPVLTPQGFLQCEHLARTFPHMDKITHVLCSPLERTIETTILGFHRVLTANAGLTIIAWPALREFGTFRCNHGEPLSALRADVAEWEVTLNRVLFDLTLVPEGWKVHTERRSERGERLARVRRELYALGVIAKRKAGGVWNGIPIKGNPDGHDVEILVVSHGAFLQALGEKTGRHFRNTEVRSYEVRLKTADDPEHYEHEYEMVETKASKTRRYVQLPALRRILDRSLASVEE